MNEDKYNGERVLCFNYWDGGFSEGFFKLNEWDSMSLLFDLVNQSVFRKRTEAEDVRCNLKHIIPYVVFKDRDWIFSYERGPSSGESRLSSKISIGVGGHINPVDAVVGESMVTTYRNALMREIREEIDIKDPSRNAGRYTPPIVGFINDNSNDVGKVHFGVVHLYDCSNMNIGPKEDCIQNGKFYSKEKIMSEFGDRLEPWSRMILDTL